MKHEERIAARTAELTHPSADPNARLVPLRKLPGAVRRRRMIRGIHTTKDMVLLAALGAYNEKHPTTRKTWAGKRATTGKRRSG